MSSGFRFLVAALAASLFAALTVWNEWLPARALPHAPLRVDDRPGPFDRFKLARLDGAGCLATLEAAAVRFRPVPDRALVDGCGLSNAVRVSALPTRLESPVVLSCRTALSLALWERRVLQREALRHLDRRVAALGHFGGPSCRNIGGGPRRSRHATADAFDLATMRLDGGERVTLDANWSGEPASAAFLHALHDGACRWFDGVLGPDYDRAHHDHLHLERGGFRFCR